MAEPTRARRRALLLVVLGILALLAVLLLVGTILGDDTDQIDPQNSRMREVDARWPAVGAKLHHSVGTWPLLLDDETVVESVTAGVSLTLQAKARPNGVARVTLRLEPIGTETRVLIEEDMVTGPARLVPKPVRDVGLRWRNVESLRRLAYVAERRAARHPESRA